MTQDKCVYTVSIDSQFCVNSIKNVCNEATVTNDDFEATVTDEQDGEVTIEVHGDAYEIPVFESQIEEISGVTVVNGDVTPGASKFA